MTNFPHLDLQAFTANVKRGFSTNDFKKKYGETALDFLLKKHQGKKEYNAWMRALKQNDEAEAEREKEKEKEKEKGEKEMKNETTKQTQNEASQMPQVTEEKLEELDPTEKEILELQRKVRNLQSCSELNSKNASSLFNDIAKYNKLVTQSKQAIKDYEAKLNKEREQCNKLVLSLNNLNLSYTSATKRISEISESIEKFENKIKELRKIIVHVNKDGDIEINKKDFEIPDTWNDVCKKLQDDDLVRKKLTLFECEQLAKLIAIFKYLNEQDTYYEISFEKTPASESGYSLEDFFNTYKE